MNEHELQQPTATNLHIRNTQDALVVFEAVRRGILRMVTRRMDSRERNTIRPGLVFVWQERSADAQASTGLGIERWTDGVGWFASRVKDDFLTYMQKIPSDGDDEGSTGGRQAITRPRNYNSHSPSYGERFIKITYSVHVGQRGRPPSKADPKWHLIAYHSKNTIPILDIIDNLPVLSEIHVPQNVYRSAKAPKNKGSARQSHAERRARRTPDARVALPPLQLGLSGFDQGDGHAHNVAYPNTDGWVSTPSTPGSMQEPHQWSTSPRMADAEVLPHVYPVTPIYSAAQLSSPPHHFQHPSDHSIAMTSRPPYQLPVPLHFAGPLKASHQERHQEDERALEAFSKNLL